MLPGEVPRPGKGRKKTGISVVRLFWGNPPRQAAAKGRKDGKNNLVPGTSRLSAGWAPGHGNGPFCQPVGAGGGMTMRWGV